MEFRVLGLEWGERKVNVEVMLTNQHLPFYDGRNKHGVAGFMLWWRMSDTWSDSRSTICEDYAGFPVRGAYSPAQFACSAAFELAASLARVGFAWGACLEVAEKVLAFESDFVLDGATITKIRKTGVEGSLCAALVIDHGDIRTCWDEKDNMVEGFSREWIFQGRSVMAVVPSRKIHLAEKPAVDLRHEADTSALAAAGYEMVE